MVTRRMGMRASAGFIALVLGASSLAGCAYEQDREIPVLRGEIVGGEPPPRPAAIETGPTADEYFYEPGWFADGVNDADLYADAIAGQRLYPSGPRNEVSLLDIEPPPLPPLGKPP